VRLNILKYVKHIAPKKYEIVNTKDLHLIGKNGF